MTDYTETSRLLAGCLAGDEVAIERLLRQYEYVVFRVALSVLDDPAEANEAAQDVFVRARVHNYRDKSSQRGSSRLLEFLLSRLRKRRTLGRLTVALQSIFRIETKRSLGRRDGHPE
jgi:DNA-directed RNA polymerase specialized sigma24 family protein